MDSATDPILNQIKDNAEENSPAKTPVLAMPGSPIATSSEKGEVADPNNLEPNADEFASAKECMVIEVPVVPSHQTPMKKHQEICRIPALPQIPEVSNPTSSSSDSSFSSREFVFFSCFSTHCCYNYNRWVKRAFNSPYALPFYFMCMALPVSAGYMGTRYMTECPAGASTPLFLFLIGLCGVLCVASRMVDVVQQMVFPRSQMWDFPSYACLFCLMTILLLLMTEMMVMLRIEPNFIDSRSDNFCNPVFYKFTYYGNFAAFALVMSSFLVYLPRIICSPSSHMYPNPYHGV